MDDFDKMLEGIELPSNKELAEETKRERNRLHTKAQWDAGTKKNNGHLLSAYNKTDAYKKSHANSIKLAQSPQACAKRIETKKELGLIGDADVYKEIYDRCFEPDRSGKLYKQLAKEYDIPYGTIHSIAHGTNQMHGLDTSDYKARLLEWNKLYGDYAYYWKIIDPQGNELVFDTMIEAGKHIAKVKNKGDIPNHQCGAIAWDMFKRSAPKRKQSGVFAGHSFIKINKHTGEQVN